MSSSLSVLLAPLQELQMEGHYCTNTVVGCVIMGSPSTARSSLIPSPLLQNWLTPLKDGVGSVYIFPGFDYATAQDSHMWNAFC